MTTTFDPWLSTEDFETLALAATRYMFLRGQVPGIAERLRRLTSPALQALGIDPSKEEDRQRIDAVVAERQRLFNGIEYRRYLGTEHWRTVRESALIRAGHRCQVCSSKHQLQVHHRTYENRGFEQPEDVTVLCDECHGLFHRHGKLAR